MFAVSSVERSSTTRTSTGSYVVAKTDWTILAMLSASFRAGTMMLTRPACVGGASKRFGEREARRANTTKGTNQGRVGAMSAGNMSGGTDGEERFSWAR